MKVHAGDRCPGCHVVCAHLDVEHLDRCPYQGRDALELVEPRRALVPARLRMSLRGLRRDRWIGAKEGGPRGNTQDALARTGTVESRWTEEPYGRQVCRLTPLGIHYVETYNLQEEGAR